MSWIYTLLIGLIGLFALILSMKDDWGDWFK